MKKGVLVAVGIILVIGGLIARVLLTRTGGTEAAEAQVSLTGIQIQDLSPAGRERLAHLTDDQRGVLVRAVLDNSPAKDAGLIQDDLIAAVNGRDVRTKGDYDDAVRSEVPSGELRLHVVRTDGSHELRLSPASAADFNELGIGLAKDSREDAAIQVYRRAIAIDPTYAEAHYNLGNAYAATGDHSKAIEQIQTALAQDPELTEARQRLAELQAASGAFEEATRTLLDSSDEAPATLSRDMKPVEVVQATTGDIASHIDASGTLEARARVAVFPQAPGIIDEIAVDEGDRVEQGQVVAVIEHEELDLMLRQAEARVRSAEANHDQALRLAQVRVMSQLADSRAGRDAAQAALEQVRDLAETRTETQIEAAQAGLDAIRANLNKIRAGARDEERKQILATLNQAEAHLANVGDDHARMKDLFEAGAVSRQTLDGARTQLTIAQAQHEAARQQSILVEKGAREEDIQAVEAQLGQAEANLRLARTQADLQTWKHDVAMAEAQVARAQAGLDTAQAFVDAESWEAEIATAEALLTEANAARDLAEEHRSDAFVTAAIAGVVAQRFQDPGSMAAPTQPLFDIADMDVVHAIVPVLEDDVPAVTVGSEARVRIKGAAEDLKGRISRISPVIDAQTRTADVEVSLDNPGHALKPGMFVRVQIPVEVHSNALILPRETVVEDPETGTPGVYVVLNGKTRRVRVTRGLTDGNRVEIADGLLPGVDVVYAGHEQLRDGDFVQVVRVVPPDAP